MADALPARANLDWLRKAAKQHLRTMRLQRREAKLAEAQYAVARQYGFASWRKLKSHVDSLRNTSGAAQSLTPDATVAAFLRAVGDGRLHDVEKALAADP